VPESEGRYIGVRYAAVERRGGVGLARL
jgi:hypothetical protein